MCDGTILQAAMGSAEVAFVVLWLAYADLGGVASPPEVSRFLEGSLDLGKPTYNLLARALNEFPALAGDPVAYLA